jgi:[acyl-carrier-protein] S-malonyltransferase
MADSHAHRRVILCPGQGAQVVGMGKAWYERSPEAREVFLAADRLLGNRLGSPLSELCFDGPVERLNQTDVSQPAIYVCSVASWRGLLASWGAGGQGAGGGAVEAGVFATAGLSLGEYTALHVAGAFSFEDGLELVTLRGRAMQDAASATPSGMVALIGADEAQAKSLCAAVLGAVGAGEVLVPANFNAPGQVVVSGSKRACEKAVEVAGTMSLRATALQVAGAFHSPLMAPAADRLRAALAKVAIHPARCGVMSNVLGAAHSTGVRWADDVRRLLVEQLTSPVRWEQNCRSLVEQKQDGEWHELAPGKTLAGLMRRIDKNVKVETHDEPV